MNTTMQEAIRVFGKQSDDHCPDDLQGFFRKVSSGIGIEELLIEDIAGQRRAGQVIRKAQRDRQQKLVEKAVKKMKEAAESRFTSAWVGAFVQVGTAALNCIFGDMIKNAFSKNIAKFIQVGTQALASGFSKFTPYDMQAVEQDGKAKMLQHQASEAGQQANDTRDWMQSARELERRMVSHLEKATNAEHQNRMDVLKNLA